MKLKIGILSFLFLTVTIGCDHDPQSFLDDLTHIPFEPTDYIVNQPQGWPILEVPESNPMTTEGVQLGRKLFYDPILSADSTISCASCHQQTANFSDNLPIGKGIDDRLGDRSSMSLLDIGYHYNGLFWDGRSETLEDQALHPIENPNEMGDDWIPIENKLQYHSTYPTLFRKAFGINSSKDIDRNLVAKAIAQFERTIVSSGNSKYDKVIRGEAFFTEDELEGYEIFFDASLDLPDGECAHCHNAPLFTINDYLNNGLQTAETFGDFEDPGFGVTSGKEIDMGKFKIPTLRNIEYSAPYMHDGRFETLEEVMEHYLSGGHQSPNRDPLIYELNLNGEQANQIIAFLRTLSDTAVLNNKKLSSPFN